MGMTKNITKIMIMILTAFDTDSLLASYGWSTAGCRNFTISYTFPLPLSNVLCFIMKNVAIVFCCPAVYCYLNSGRSLLPAYYCAFLILPQLPSLSHFYFIDTLAFSSFPLYYSHMAIEALSKLLFFLFSAAVAFMDIKTGAVPRIAFVLAFPLFFILKLVSDAPLWPSIAGALAGLSVFLLAFFISKKKLGLADVWYSSLIGLALGLWHWYIAVSFACLLGIAYILLLKKPFSFKPSIPFIPFMAAGAAAAVIIEG
jgi:prepilin signal peptidase PulO-like enzyme (type II secretory pathway)